MMDQIKPIAHLVFWKLNGQTPEAKKIQARKIIQAFLSLKNKIDGLLRLEVGQNSIDHPDAWDISVSMVFESAAMLHLYQTHPCHLDIKQLVGPMKLARGQVDYELTIDEINTWKETT